MTQQSHLQREMKTYVYLKTALGNFIGSHQKLKTTQVSIDLWMDNKLWYIYMIDYYSSVERQ